MDSSSFDKRDFAVLAAVIAAAFVVRILLFSQQGYQNDMSTYQYWFNTAAEQGVRPFYSYVMEHAGWIDYPPFNVYIFWAFGSLSHAIYGATTEFFVKIVPTIFDLVTAALIFLFLRRQFTFKQTFIATCLYAFNPAVIFNVAWWGQFDAIYTFFLVLSLMLALKKKPEMAAVSFAIALLTKPQGIALLPLVALVIFMKVGPKRLLTSIAAFAATIFVVVLPFEGAIANPVSFLSEIYFGAYGGYPFTSINAFNIWGMFGMWVQDGGFYFVGWGLFILFAALFLVVTFKRFKEEGEALVFFSASMILFAFFMLPTRIHERYLFPVLSVLALSFLLYNKSRIIYAVLTGTLLVNQAYVLYWLNLTPNGAPNLTGDPVVLVVSVINLVMFLYGTLLMVGILRGQHMQAAKELPQNQQTPKGEMHSDIRPETNQN